MRILILEDDPLIALDLQFLVEDCGHEVAFCASLAEAARETGFDFAILDIDLPDGKSFDLANRLTADRIPFVFLSASRKSELPACLGNARFIAKPYLPATIRTSLDQIHAIAS